MDKALNHALRLPRDTFFPAPPALPIAVVEKHSDKQPISKNDFTYLPHTHSFQELVAVSEGTGVQWIDGQEFPVLRGDLFLLRGDREHCFKAPCTMHLYNLLFVQEELPLPYDLLRKMPGYQMFFHAGPTLGTARHRYGMHLGPEKIDRLIRQITALEELLRCCRVGYEAKAILLLLEIFINISENAEENLSDADGLLPRISLALSKMEQDISRDWKIEELAEITYTSPRNFLRLFSKVIGTSPIAYLLHLRLTQAGEYLSRGTSIAETAQLCGFHDANYFGKQFKKLYGVSPRAYGRSSGK